MIYRPKVDSRPGPAKASDHNAAIRWNPTLRMSVAYIFVEQYASTECLHPDSIRERSRAADLPFSRAGNHNLLLI